MQRYLIVVLRYWAALAICSLVQGWIRGSFEFLAYAHLWLICIIGMVVIILLERDDQKREG